MSARTLQEFSAELLRQAESKHDYIVDTRELTLLNGSELHATGVGEFPLRDLAHTQIATYLGIPTKYYDELRRDGNPKVKQLLDTNVNTLMRERPRERMLRTLDGQARAFLSTRYRRLDNDQLANAVLPVLAEIPDVQFPGLEITENRLYIKAVSPRTTAEIKVGDFVQAGVVISNSEVGLGTLKIEGLIYRLICSNGMITGDAVSRRHVGRRIEGNGNGDDDHNYDIYSDEALRADDNAFWLKVRDLTRAAVNESRFRAAVDKLKLSTETDPLKSVSSGVREIGNRFQLSEGEQDSVLRHLITGHDLTKYGAIQAVTRAAQDVESYDRSVELERIGGQILDAEPSWWRQLAAVD
jgi:Domain of unknown function (DUF932)